MEYIEPVLYIGMSQSFFSGLLISTKRPITIANRLMSAWLFLICIELLLALINSNVIEMYAFPFIAFTYGPLLYLYVLFITNPARKLNWFSLIHLIPFVVFFAVSVIFRNFPLLKDLRTFFEPDRFISLRLVYSSAFFISVSAYSIMSFIEIKKHQKLLQDIVSYTSRKITLNWLKTLAVTYYITFLSLFILGGLNIIGDFIPFDPYLVIFCAITLFSSVYSFYGIKQSDIFGEEIQVEEREPEKYIKSGLKEKQADEYLARLLDIMAKDKPYLNRDLSIQDLSVLTGIPRHYITQVLNEKHGKNFFTFINDYRVQEVIARFNNPSNNNYTILAIAFDAGFNSKTTFNSIFKTVTGMTPSKFRLNMTGIAD